MNLSSSHASTVSSASSTSPPDRRAERAATIAVVTASSLGALKLVGVMVTGSLALAASFVDSLMDIFASLVNLLAVRIGSRPADDAHRFGHGKAESLAGMFQAAVIGFSGVYLVVESVRRLLEGGAPSHEAVGVAAMAVAMVVSVWITWLLRRTARVTGSVALYADSLHYASDVWMNAGVFVALALVAWTGQAWIDPVTGLVVAFLVLRSSWSVLRLSIDELMDSGLGADTEAAVRAAVTERVPGARRISDLRTRRAGQRRFVELTVAFDRSLSFSEAHRLSEDVRAAVHSAVPSAEVSVHADPYPLLPDDHPVPADAPEVG